jgi:hypothetical protein
MSLDLEWRTPSESSCKQVSLKEGESRILYSHSSRKLELLNAGNGYF